MDFVHSKIELMKLIEENKEKKIVVLHGDALRPHLGAGGKSQIATDLLRKLAETGHHVIVVSSYDQLELAGKLSNETLEAFVARAGSQDVFSEEFKKLGEILKQAGDVAIGRILNPGRGLGKRVGVHGLVGRTIIPKYDKEKTPGHERGRDKQAFKPRRRW